MTADREEQIKKGLLWEYSKTVSALEAFRVSFRALADRFDSTAKILRSRPETLADIDFNGIRSEFEIAIIANEYKEMANKNAECKDSLVKMGVL